LSLLGKIMSESAQSVRLGWILAVRDIKAQYRQSLLGVFWMIAPPIVMSVGLTVAQGNGYFKPGEMDLPTPAYIFISTALWQMFSAGVNGPIGGLNMLKGLMTRVHFPAEAALVSDICKQLFRIAIQAVVIVFALFYFGLTPSWSLLAAPLALFALVLFANLVGMILAPVAMLYKDINNALPLGLWLWMFLTPVVFPWPPYGGIFATTVRMNPVSPLLVTLREAIAGLPLSQLPYFFIVLSASLLVLPVILIYYRASMPIIIERWSA